MDIVTHKTISTRLCGTPVSVENGASRVSLETDKEMAVDDFGLVHGGFVFGLADHAAMIAVNHPNVVLGAAGVKFLKPVRAGQTIIADAKVLERQGRKQIVSVDVRSGDDTVFSGEFTCFTLDNHVLAPSGS
jgi:uncharacterized protein (TIGR00369 family)